jgi:predicted nucleic acid-binding protein
VEFDDRPVVAGAVTALAYGMDFADALHLYGARDSDVFVTFDEDFRRRANKLPDAVPAIAPE